MAYSLGVFAFLLIQIIFLRKFFRADITLIFIHNDDLISTAYKLLYLFSYVVTQIINFKTYFHAIYMIREGTMLFNIFSINIYNTIGRFPDQMEIDQTIQYHISSNPSLPIESILQRSLLSFSIKGR